MVQEWPGSGWRFEIILFIPQQTFGVTLAHEASGTLVLYVTQLGLVEDTIA